MENIFRNGATRWQISEHVKLVQRMFLLGLTDNEILTFEIYDLENAGQGYYVYTSPWYHSLAMVNIQNLQVVMFIFVLVLIISEILTFYIFTLKNMSRSRNANFAMNHSIVNFKICKIGLEFSKILVID